MAKNRAKNANFGKNWQKSREISVFLGLKIKKIGNVPPPSIRHHRVLFYNKQTCEISPGPIWFRHINVIV